MLRILLIILPVLLMAAVGSAAAADTLKMERIVLLQPEKVLEVRVASVDAFAGYVKSVNEATAGVVAKHPVAPSAGFVVLAVRPGGASKVWFDFSPALTPTLERELRAAVEHVRPFDAKEGVVVYAIGVSLWGAPLAADAMPYPAEWLEESKRAGSAIEVGDLVERLWPSSRTPDPVKS